MTIEIFIVTGGPHPEGPHSWCHFLEVGGWAEDGLGPEHHQLSGDGGYAGVIGHGRDYQWSEALIV